MERIDAGDVLQVIRMRVDELERENAVMRSARDGLLAQNAHLQTLLHRKDTLLYEARRSRDGWKKKATERKRRFEGMRFYLVDSHPKSKRHMKAAA